MKQNNMVEMQPFVGELIELDKNELEGFKQMPNL